MTLNINASEFDIILHSSILMHRIEEQLVDKFNRKFSDSRERKTKSPTGYNKQELIELSIEWITFLLEEKAVQKEMDMNIVLHMKNDLCDIRIKVIMAKCEKWGITSDIKNIINHPYLNANY